MKFKPGYIILVIAGIFIGFVLAAQLKVVDNDTGHRYDFLNMERPQVLATKIEEARVKNKKLQKQVEDLRNELDKAAVGPQLAELKEKVDEVRAFAALTKLKGPGVKVVLNDSQEDINPEGDPNLYILHDEDLLRVLNELKASGAEALSINDHRITATTEVRCIGPTVLINKKERLSAPFVIKAIGDPDTLYNALKMPGGVADRLKFWGIEINVEKASGLVVLPYEGGVNFNYARPAK